MRRTITAYVAAVTVIMCGFFWAMSTPAQSQDPLHPLVDTPETREAFKQAAFMTAMPTVTEWMDGELSTNMMVTLHEEGFSTDAMYQFLEVGPAARALKQAEAAVACYFDGMCDYNVRGWEWLIENPDNWYTSYMQDPEYACSHWPDFMDMPLGLFWECYGLPGGVSSGGGEVGYQYLACWKLWISNKEEFQELTVQEQVNCFEAMQ